MSENRNYDDPAELSEKELAEIIEAIEREHKRESLLPKKVIILNGTVIQNVPATGKGRGKQSIRSD